ncbi:MAG: UbiD family decarboxylase [Bacteroidales bacterium]|nr:UbiD family decarboxylase [Bacteroidales bacterium]
MSRFSRPRTLTDTVRDLERAGQLVRIDYPIDPELELAEVQRRLYRHQAPAVLFTHPKGTTFPMLANLFGTRDRMRFLFRDTLDDVRKLVELKADPEKARRKPWRYWNLPLLLSRLRPRFVASGPILRHQAPLSALPRLRCWPDDGGAFVTLPQVYTEDPDHPGWSRSNLGMYRVQISGGEYVPDREVGLHYQIHRGIGVHHAAARRRGERLRVNVVIGGPPALALAAVMPLPEGMPELAFAAALSGHRLRLVLAANGLPMPADADFVISGSLDPTATKPEGPFGDHLGYYSLTHPFPVMTVDAVYHRPGAIWPFTVVGRPPQEDTVFGEFIHELTGPVLPTVLPGLRAVHAVDAAGVHPLLLAIGSERYVPYAAERRPQELLTLAHAILGQGQLSLAKYLFIVAQEDDPTLDIHDIPAFLRHLLERFDPTADLHFQTRTTIDTLDYSAGEGLNAGSKLVIAAAGPVRRRLGTTIPESLRFPEGWGHPQLVLPGILAIAGPPFRAHQEDTAADVQQLIQFWEAHPSLAPDAAAFPLLVLVDDAAFTAASVSKALWVVFTRSNPAADVYGIGATTHRKHWGCRGSLMIDARLKPHMAPPLVEDPAITKRVDALAARGGPLHGLIG